MSKQERRAKATKAAAVEAEALISSIKDKVLAESDAMKTAKQPRTRALPAEHLALGEEVKRQRDAGVAWWVIGHTLNLPGSADNVREGKGGASYARRIYGAVYGEVPRTITRTGMRSDRETNKDVKAVKAVTKRDRVATVRSGGSVLRPEMTDEEVLDMLRGRVIAWSLDTAKVGDKTSEEPHYLEQTTGVHRQWAKIEMHGGARCIVFKEWDPTAPIKYRMMAGATRIVRVEQIHTVR